jgi:drug/metabolite transporter (DMT)-like permease
MNRLAADGLLLLTAAIWGTAFVAQKAANATMGPITFVGARFLLSALLVLPLAVWESRRAPQPLARRELRLAGSIGICLFLGSVLQQTALVTTTATNGGFLTALYVVLVPFTTWLLTGERVRKAVGIACLVSIAGAWLLSARNGLQGIVLGDALLLLSDIPWAVGISLVAVFLGRAPRPFFLACAQYAVTAALGLAAGLALEPVAWDGVAAALPALLYAGLISGGIAFTLQVVAQRHTPAPEAALIMSLESVAAAVAGGLALGERLSAGALAGCGLILLGVAIAEVGPLLRPGVRPPARS